MNFLAFLGFILGLISVLITLQYVNTCNAAKLLASAQRKEEKVTDLDRVIFTIQEKSELDDAAFYNALRNVDVQKDIVARIIRESK